MSSKQRMIDQSYNLFCEHGENFSLSQVTNVLGIKKQSIYNYFSGKDELIIEMLNSKVENYYYDFIDLFENLEHAELKEKLYELGKFTIGEFEDEQRLKFRHWLSMSMTTKGIADIKSIVKLNESKFRDLVRDFLREGIESGTIKNEDIEFIVTAYIVLLRGIVDGILSIESYGDSQGFFEKMFECYWSMITS